MAITVLIHKVAISTSVTELWAAFRAIGAVVSQARGINTLVFLQIEPVVFGALLAHFGVLLTLVTLLDFAGQVEASILFEVVVKAFFAGVAFEDARHAAIVTHVELANSVLAFTGLSAVSIAWYTLITRIGS